jgi:phage baseplate assembly protein W
MSVDNLVSIRDIQEDKAYLGKGMSWPPEEDPTTGDFKKAEAEASISVCIRHLLETYIGSYPVLREFGTRLDELLFSIGTGAVGEAIATSLKDGLTRFEKRVDFVNSSIKVETNDKGTRTAFIKVRYRVRATGRVETNVFTVDPDKGVAT